MKSFSIVALVLLLTACASKTIPTELTGPRYDYIATLDIDINANKEELAKLYNAEVVSFQPDAGFAILALSAEEAELHSLKADVNKGVLASPILEAHGFSVWANGFSVWAGGWSVWAGGWNAWAGGSSTLPTFPRHNRERLRSIKLPQAHAISKHYGEGVTVAVIDTGLHIYHPLFYFSRSPKHQRKDFINRQREEPWEGGRTTKAYGHGSGVAGLIMQVAPKARIMPLRVLDADGKADVNWLLSAVEFAVENGADVINLSLGGNEDIKSLKTVIDYATSKKVYVVASAGNTSKDLTYPAAYAANNPYLISVGSSNSKDQLSNFSARGSSLELLAPGEDVYSVYSDPTIDVKRGLAQFKGTSFAAPLVSGAIALALGELKANQALSAAANIEHYLKASADTTSDGYKRINLTSLVKSLPNYTPKKALFIANKPQALNPSDTAVKRVLNRLGYTIQIVDDDAAKPSNAQNKDLVLISSSVNSKFIGSMYRDIDVPIITWEPYLYDDLKMTGAKANQNYGNVANSSLSLLTDTHPLAAGYTGTLTPLASDDILPWGQPSSSATHIASVSGKPSLFAYDKGAEMHTIKAAHRRIALPLTDTINLSTEGVHLLEAAITWASSGN